MRDYVNRAIRTFFQAFVATFSLLAVPALNDAISSVTAGGEVVIDLNFLGNAALAGVFSGVIALITLIHNVLEDSHTVKPVLKDTEGRK